MMYGFRWPGHFASVLQQIGVFVVDGTHDEGAGQAPITFSLHVWSQKFSD